MPLINHPPIRRFCRYLCLFCLLGLADLGYEQPLYGQSTDVAYWQYDAIGQLEQIVLTDFNRDGVDDLLLLADETNVALIEVNDPTPMWQYQTETPITYMTTMLQQLGN